LIALARAAVEISATNGIKLEAEVEPEPWLLLLIVEPLVRLIAPRVPSAVRHNARGIDVVRSAVPPVPIDRAAVISGVVSVVSRRAVRLRSARETGANQ
jgi:hypothetical protein